MKFQHYTVKMIDDKMTRHDPQLIEGADSGPISGKTKLHVAFNSGGKCYFPGCPKHLTLHGTNIGECAHIIPKKVGFVREDWQTPLTDRAKAANLIYVCSDHHAVIDDPDNATTYPASALRAWKDKHEAWALSQDKNAPGIPGGIRQRLEETADSLSQELTREARISTHLLTRLLGECQTLLRRRYLDKAEVLLSQAAVLLADVDNPALNADLRALQAYFLWRQGKIRESKAAYLKLLEEIHHVEGMLDYIELCDSAPEEGDRSEEYEAAVRKAAPDHPRLSLMELMRRYRLRKTLDIEVTEEEWSDDEWINAQFYLQYALLFDLAHEQKKRDHFICQWERRFPESPRPALFRALFMTVGAARKGISNETEAVTLLEKIHEQERRIYLAEKDPLGPADRMSLLVDKIKVNLSVLHFSLADPTIVGELRNEFLSLVNNSYFDSHVNVLLPEVLRAVVIERPQWDGLVAAIRASKVEASGELNELMFLHGLNLGVPPEEIRRCIAVSSGENLNELLNAVEHMNAPEILRIINKREDEFKLMLLQSINDPHLRVSLVRDVEWPEANGPDKLYFHIEALLASGHGKEALDLAKNVNVDEVTPAFLRLINHLACKFNDQKLIVVSAEKLLTFGLPKEQRTECQGKLATAYFHLGDDRNALRHATVALEDPVCLGATNTRTLIIVATESLLALGRGDDAAEFIKLYQDRVPDTPELGIFFAATVLKSSLNDRVETALDCITQAFLHSPNDEKLYLCAFLVLNQLAGLGAISSQSLDAVDDGHFVKIEGLDDIWFYIGEGNEFGATRINPGDSRYLALKGKSLGEALDWPGDKYAPRKTTKRPSCIFERSAYLYARSHEIMQAMAKKGEHAVWAVEVMNEDGSLNKENLIRFHREEFQSQHDFFDGYCREALPFGLLCRVEGSIPQALGRIGSENRGFVRCNNGTRQDQQEQYQVAQRIVGQDQPFFIDGLAVLMLSEAKLLSPVTEALSGSMHVSTSVIKVLRDIAGSLQPDGRVGRMGFAGGQLRFTERNEEDEVQLRARLLAAADILDELPNRHIGDLYEKSQAAELDVDSLFPRWLVDTVRLAQEIGCDVITDDALALQAYALKEGGAPASSSSLALMRCLSEDGIVTWEQYLQYFSLLSRYRYFHMPVSVEDMERTVLGSSRGGVVLFTPGNLDLLNLDLTFSSDYGVEDKVAVRVSALFLHRIIIRDDVTEDMAEEIFSRVLVAILAGRDAKAWGRVISNLCKKLLDDNLLVSGLSEKKLALLERQVSSYAEGFNPILSKVPSLLKVRKYGSA